jgi:hypothetical protein
LGFAGGLSILKEHLHAVRANPQAKRAYVRMEPGPGERFEIDWGHFGVLSYQGHAGKLYAFCLVECHSRELYVEFTHSQSFETFVRTFTPFITWAEWRANFGMTIWRRPSPSTMAIWYVSIPAFSPLRANTVSCRAPAMYGQRGKKEKSKDL